MSLNNIIERFTATEPSSFFEGLARRGSGICAAAAEVIWVDTNRGQFMAIASGLMGTKAVPQPLTWALHEGLYGDISVRKSWSFPLHANMAEPEKIAMCPKTFIMRCYYPLFTARKCAGWWLVIAKIRPLMLKMLASWSHWASISLALFTVV